jgi:peroxiredoxin
MTRQLGGSAGAVQPSNTITPAMTSPRCIAFHKQRPSCWQPDGPAGIAMALTPSTMLELGTPLPAFSLPAVAGGSISSADLHGRPLLLMVICAHCPFVKHVEPEVSRLEQDYGTAVQLLAVSSNSLITHPQDGPEQLADQAKRWGWSFPYLLDEQQSLAKALRAACRPFDIAVSSMAAAPATTCRSTALICAPPSMQCSLARP